MKKIFALKAILKNIAKTIRKTRVELKDYQREHGGNDGGYFYDLYKLSREFRHKHIAYCLLRGTERDLIEKPGEKNAPDEKLIQEIMDEYRETPENVRACA